MRSSSRSIKSVSNQSSSSSGTLSCLPAGPGTIKTLLRFLALNAVVNAFHRIFVIIGIGKVTHLSKRYECRSQIILIVDWMNGMQSTELVLVHPWPGQTTRKPTEKNFDRPQLPVPISDSYSIRFEGVQNFFTNYGVGVRWECWIMLHLVDDYHRDKWSWWDPFGWDDVTILVFCRLR